MNGEGGLVGELLFWLFRIVRRKVKSREFAMTIEEMDSDAFRVVAREGGEAQWGEVVETMVDGKTGTIWKKRGRKARERIVARLPDLASVHVVHHVAEGGDWGKEDIWAVWIKTQRDHPDAEGRQILHHSERDPVVQVAERISRMAQVELIEQTAVRHHRRDDPRGGGGLFC